MGVQGLGLLSKTAFAGAVLGAVVGTTEFTVVRECAVLMAAG